MADVYKQSFKQNYTNNIELSIFNCGLERCAPGQTWGPGIRDHYLIHLVVSGKRAHLRGDAGRSVLRPPQPAHPLYGRRDPALGIQLGRLQRSLRP